MLGKGGKGEFEALCTAGRWIEPNVYENPSREASKCTEITKNGRIKGALSSRFCLLSIRNAILTSPPQLPISDDGDAWN